MIDLLELVAPYTENLPQEEKDRFVGIKIVIAKELESLEDDYQNNDLESSLKEAEQDFNQSRVSVAQSSIDIKTAVWRIRQKDSKQLEVIYAHLSDFFGSERTAEILREIYSGLVQNHASKSRVYINEKLAQIEILETGKRLSE